MAVTLALVVVAFASAVARCRRPAGVVAGDGRAGAGRRECYVIFFNLSWGPVMWVMLGEMFPNQIRGSGLAVAGAAQWTSNFAITMTFPILLAGIGLAGAYGIYAAAAVMSVFFVLKYVHETKRQGTGADGGLSMRLPRPCHEAACPLRHPVVNRYAAEVAWLSRRAAARRRGDRVALDQLVRDHVVDHHLGARDPCGGCCAAGCRSRNRPSPRPAGGWWSVPATRWSRRSCRRSRPPTGRAARRVRAGARPRPRRRPCRRCWRRSRSAAGAARAVSRRLQPGAIGEVALLRRAPRPRRCRLRRARPGILRSGARWRSGWDGP